MLGKELIPLCQQYCSSNPLQLTPTVSGRLLCISTLYMPEFMVKVSPDPGMIRSGRITSAAMRPQNLDPSRLASGLLANQESADPRPWMLLTEPTNNLTDHCHPTRHSTDISSP